MRLKLTFTAVAIALATWAPTSSARQTVALPNIFGAAPGDSVGQATGVDTIGSGLLTVNPNININTLNDVGGGITTTGIDLASISFIGNSTVTGFTGTSLRNFLAITAGANATTVNLNGNVFTTTFNISGNGTVNFNGSLNPAVTAANTIFASDGFINVGANQLFNSAIVNLATNTGTLTLNGGSSVIGAIGASNGLKQINLAGGNSSVTGEVRAQGFNLGTNTLTITGALTTNAAGLINTTFASDSVFGKIVVNGNSAINAGGVTVVPTVTGALTNGTTYTIVEAPSGTNDATVSVINNNPRFTFAGLPTSLGNVNIQLVGVAPLATLVSNPGALAIAPILDVNAPLGSDLRTIQDAIAVLPTAASIDNALTQLAPGNTNLAAPWIAGQATRMFEDQWMARFDEIQNHCCDNSCDTTKAREEQNAQECGTNKQLSNWWGKATGSVGSQDNRQGMSGYETGAAGLMIGYDVPISNYSRIGVGGGYTRSAIDDNNSPSNTDVDSYQVTGYFEYAPQPWFMRAALTAGVDRYESSRSVSFPGITRDVDADYKGKQYTGLLAVGKHFYYNETTITPLASLQATHIKVDSFNEKGGGDINLNVDSQDYDFLQSSLGVKVERVIKTSNGAVSPEAHVRWLHDFNSTTMEQTASFNGGGQSFKAQGIRQDRDLYNVGAGFTMFYCNCEKNAWSVKGLYDYKWNDSEFSLHQVSLIANWKF